MFDEKENKYIENQCLEILFNQYKIKLMPIKNSINIQIEKNESFDIFQSSYTLEYLQKNKLFMTNSIEEMTECIRRLIVQNNIKIIENKINYKLILIIMLPNNLSNYPNVELILNKKDLLSNEVIEKLMNEIQNLKNENKLLKNNYDILNNRLKVVEKENDKFKEEIKQNKINNKNILHDKIANLERLHKYKLKVQLTECNLQNINSIQPHNGYIRTVTSFPSGNIISVSDDKSINIYDNNLNILQRIENAHDDSIIYVEIKDENNFITCSDDKNIKLWIKNNNEFKINKIIYNAHEDIITKLIYCSNGNLISCSFDKIKIWENSNNNYHIIKTLIHNYVWSILFLEDKNILISSGFDGTKFWNLNKNYMNYNNINYIQHFKKVLCYWNGGLCRLDEDRIIVGGDYTLNVISILNKIIIRQINYPFRCLGIKLIEDKGIFLVGGGSKDIMIYRNDNYKCIQIIKNAHDSDIFGFVELQDGRILSYSDDNKLKKWNF